MSIFDQIYACKGFTKPCVDEEILKVLPNHAYKIARGKIKKSNNCVSILDSGFYLCKRAQTMGAKINIRGCIIIIINGLECV
mgnify:CR=1 FL=1